MSTALAWFSFSLRKGPKYKVCTEAAVTWKSADLKWGGGMDVSMAWIERGCAFAFRQVPNSVTAKLVSLNLTEGEVTHRISEIVEQQKALIKAIALNDEKSIREALFPLLHEHFGYLGEEGIKMVGKCGEKAIPVLQHVLLEEESSVLCRAASREMERISPDVLASTLNAVIKQELAFWKMNGPNLKVDWSVGLVEKELRCLEHHHAKILTILTRTKDFHNEGTRAAVSEFQKFWLLLPQLRRDESDGVPKICDLALNRMSSKNDSK
jgi:hypothetical protein